MLITEKMPENNEKAILAAPNSILDIHRPRIISRNKTERPYAFTPGKPPRLKPEEPKPGGCGC